MDSLRRWLELSNMRTTLLRLAVICLGMALIATVVTSFLEVDKTTDEMRVGLLQPGVLNELFYFLYGFMGFLFPVMAVGHMLLWFAYKIFRLPYRGLDLVTLGLLAGVGVMGPSLLYTYLFEPQGRWIDGMQIGFALIVIPGLVSGVLGIAMFIYGLWKRRKA